MPNRPSVQEQIRFDHLTWPEINEAAAQKKLVLLPIGAIQQHGPHLPVDTDVLIVTALALASAARRPALSLVAPTIPYSYNLESMDFPGTVTVAARTFMDYTVSVVKGFAYHGFDHILLLNGFAPNDNLVELVARQINLETGALCASVTWTSLLRFDPSFNPSWRASAMPGSSHADELESSVYLALDALSVAMELAGESKAAPTPQDPMATFAYEDHFAAGSIYVPEWTSARTDDGVLGEPSHASAAKGRRIFDQAVEVLAAVLDEFHARPKRPSVDHHTVPILGPLPLTIS
jgi:creatinine amidohydrolase